MHVSLRLHPLAASRHGLQGCAASAHGLTLANEESEGNTTVRLGQGRLCLPSRSLQRRSRRELHVTPSPAHPKGLVMVPRRRNARGFIDPLRPYGPLHAKDPPCASQKIVILRRGDSAVRAVIGPLTKTRQRIKTGSRLR